MADVGRPTIMTPETISKLEEVFAIGGSDEEACFYANIGKTTLYNYQQDNPEFVERKNRLREKPVLKARQTVVKSLEDPNIAFRYLEKKRRKEFGNSLDLTSDNERITLQESDKIISELTQKLNAIYKGASVTGDGEGTSAVGAETQDKE